MYEKLTLQFAFMVGFPFVLFAVVILWPYTKTKQFSFHKNCCWHCIMQKWFRVDACSMHVQFYPILFLNGYLHIPLVPNPIPKILGVYPYHIAQLTVRNRLKWLSADQICLLCNKVQDPGRSQRRALGRALSSVGQGTPWQYPLHMLRAPGCFPPTSRKEYCTGKGFICSQRPG